MFKLITEKESKKTIPMPEMKPLQIGRIKSGEECLEDIVMRTASLDKFEVMDLSCPGKDSCWESPNSIDVELLPVGSRITLEVTE